MPYELNGHSIDHDEEGYIDTLSDWSRELAEIIAHAENIEMTEDHWKIVDFVRNYYDTFNIAPAIRVLVRALKREFGPEIGNNAYLDGLFPGGPAKQACKIAGLPKPTGCI